MLVRNSSSLNLVYSLLTVCLATFFLSWAAILNGFPLVFSDSGTYLDTALSFSSLPLDRPIFYSFFLLPMHGTLSLWPIVFFQNLIFLYVLYLTLRTMIGTVHRIYFLLVTLALAIFSSLPWHSGQIMADYFTAIVVLLCFLLGMCHDKLSRTETSLCCLGLTGMITLHLTHLPLVIGLTLALVLVNLLPFNRHLLTMKMLAMLIGSIFTAVCLLASVHLLHRGELTLAPMSHAFLMGRFIADGPIKKYLNEHCDEKHYALCDYQDELPTTMDAYIWKSAGQPDSLLSRTGGTHKTRAESRELILASLRTYPLWHLQNALTAFQRQLVSFDTGNGLHSYLGDWSIYRTIQKHFPDMAPSYETSLQSTGKLPISIIRPLHRGATYVGLVVACIWAIVAIYRRDGRWLGLFLLVLTSLVLNAAVCGVLSGVHDRFQSRLIWLVPFIALLGGLFAIHRSSKRRPT